MTFIVLGGADGAEETRALFGRDDIDVFPVQRLKRPVSGSALVDARTVSRGSAQRIEDALEAIESHLLPLAEALLGHAAAG